MSTVAAGRYRRWVTPEPPVDPRTSALLKSFFLRQYREHAGPDAGATSLEQSIPEIAQLVAHRRMATVRLGSALAHAVANALSFDHDLSSWAQSVIRLPAATEVNVHALGRLLRTRPEGDRNSDDGLLALERFLMLLRAEEPIAELEQLMELCLCGMAILPGGENRRELFNWTLTTAIPWSLSNEEPVPGLPLSPRPEWKKRTSNGRIGDLNWGVAARNVYNDLHGDWYFDRWLWPELWQAVRSKRRRPIVEGFGSAPRWSIPVRVSKADGSVRPAVLLHPNDRMVFQALVDAVAGSLAAGAQTWAFGWQPRRTGPRKPGRYERRDVAWMDYLGHLKTGAEKFSYALRVDVREFFASISLDILGEMLSEACAPAEAEIVAELVAFLRSWQAKSIQPGIPQRCFASSVLANFYLRPVDDYLSRLGQDVFVTRWMDDVWVFGTSASRLERVLDEVRDRLIAIGLFCNQSKTRIFERDGFDGELLGLRPQMPKLQDLVRHIVSKPHAAPRPLIRHACSEIKNQRSFKVLRLVEPKLWDLRQGSDHLAGALQLSPDGPALAGWFLSRLKDRSPLVQWSLGHFGRIFLDRTSEVGPSFLQTVADRERDPVLRATLATTVGGASASSSVREALIDVAELSDEPLVVRAAALGALSGSWTARDKVVELLEQFDDLTDLALLIRGGWIGEVGSPSMPVGKDFY